MPKDWVSTGDFTHLAIHQGPSVPSDCRENEVVQGTRYDTIQELKEAVQCWSLSLMREFITVRCGRDRYEVECMQQGCPWRVHAYKGTWKDYWECSIVTEHTCHLPGVQRTHRNLTSEFIAGEMYGMIVNNLSFEPRSIIRYIEEKFKYTISYKKAWRAKRKLLEKRFGTFEVSYDNLPRLLATICQRNPDNYYDIKHIPGEQGPPFIMQRAFFTLGPCVKAFQHCRPIMCIDGTFLIGKYRGHMLTAIAADGNNQLLPVAFAFV